MRERPILFSGPMVRALLAGTKTQTRRIVKAPISAWLNNANGSHKVLDGQVFNYSFEQHLGNCPYGQPDDRLWVRESFMDLRGTGVEHYAADGRRQRYAFAADSPPGSYSDETRKDYGLKWKPSIHMPRSACRLVLEVTGVRVERLNDISETDAKAEGCAPAWLDADDNETVHALVAPTYRQGFARLWRDINGAESWQANPWVWVVEFRVLAHPDHKDGGAA